MELYVAVIQMTRMTVLLKNEHTVNIRLLKRGDEEKLFHYFSGFSEETKRRFGPHPFDHSTITYLCNNNDQELFCFIAETADASRIIAYAIIKPGLLSHEITRLTSYGIIPAHYSDCTYAPSVADDWQCSGLGSRLFEVMVFYLKQKWFKRIFLWGGVQSSNEKAVNYYRKLGFIKLGEFEYNGSNLDMLKEI